MTFKKLIFSVFLLSSMVVFSQNNSWKQTSENQILVKGNKLINPSKSLIFQLNFEQFVASLSTVNRINQGEILIPDDKGNFSEFIVIENSTMHKDYASKFPEIRSFDIYKKGNENIWGAIDHTPQGFHAMIFYPGESTLFIDPLYFNDPSKRYYQIYRKSDLEVTKDFSCNTESLISQQKYENEVIPNKSYSSCEFRNYRLAVSATGEYSVFQGGTLVLAAAAQVTTINRVNQVYKRDLSVSLTIIPNNDLIIYTNPSNDPFTNGATGTMINQNQTNTNNVIGSANYDIGHVFGTNSGGLAGLGVVCSNSSKARGVTGSSAPVNDPFDIDYVAHEVGHQFGANHTFNNSCSGNRNSSTAYETGSGSTIMAYAGICAPNVQNNSDDYFHAVSLQEIGVFVNENSHTCPVKTPINNNPPSVSSIPSSINLPVNTPFALTAVATDTDNDTLTYTWEQMDRQISTQAPLSTATQGPNFRSFSPTTSPTRYFPDLQTIINGGSTTWEVIPSVSRAMNFRVSVRDNNYSGTCTDYENVTVNFHSSAGPFVVNYPSATNIIWQTNTTQTITWSVANTNVSPVACSNVDIKISYDGGVTFQTLLANTPNDGSQQITVPNTISYNAIIMVMCENGTFFDVSDNIFYIIDNNCVYPTISPNENLSYGLCFGGNVTLKLTQSQLNGAVNWVWYSNSCGNVQIGVGDSVVVSSSGTYYVRGEGGCITVPSNCTSVSVNNVNFNSSIYTQSSTSSITLIATQNNATYQWYDCATNQPIVGQTGKNFVPTANGTYYAAITFQGCTRNSTCIEVKTLGTTIIESYNVSVYPNPSSGKFNISLENYSDELNLRVLDVTGKLIFTEFSKENNNYIIDLTPYNQGVYLLEIIIDDQKITQKLIKE